MELTDFLLARVAEDEATVVAILRQNPRWDADGAEVCDSPDRILAYVRGDYAAEHIARWDPARVLAECDAKRRIVELHKSWPVLVEQQPELAAPAAGLNDLTFRMTQQIAWATQEEYRKRFGDEPPTTPMLRALALPYADHPDYLEEWRP